MIKSIKYKVVFFLMPGFPIMANAQVDTAFVRAPITHSAYLNLVGKENLGYVAEKFNLNIAEANIEAAKVFPDPELSLGAVDNGQRRMKMGYGFNTDLGWTLELGGKRKARIHLAKSEAGLIKALLEDYFRNLRADATLAYVNGIKQHEVFRVKLSSYKSMKGIADADSIRFKKGSISEVDARQSKLEAASMLNDVYQGEADWKMALVQLNMSLGKHNADTLYMPSGDFVKFDRDFNINELVIRAQNNRTDLLAALKNKHVSQDALALVKANRTIDLGLTLGAANTSVISNMVAPTPSLTAVSAGISIPLKFSNRNKGEVKAAEYGSQQADVLYKQTELQIHNEVMQAWYGYQAVRKQVVQFKTGLLADASRVLDGKKYSYKRGETTLLEVLNAQKTYNETQLSYFETLHNYAAALVELERAAGFWDIEF